MDKPGKNELLQAIIGIAAFGWVIMATGTVCLLLTRAGLETAHILCALMIQPLMIAGLSYTVSHGRLAEEAD